MCQSKTCQQINWATHKQSCWRGPNEVQLDARAWLKSARVPVTVAVILALDLPLNSRAALEHIVVFHLDRVGLELLSRRRRIDLIGISVEPMENLGSLLHRSHYDMEGLASTLKKWCNVRVSQVTGNPTEDCWPLAAFSIQCSDDPGDDVCLLHTFPVSRQMVAMAQGVGRNWRDGIRLWILNRVR